jgi:hypothetical protein
MNDCASLGITRVFDQRPIACHLDSRPMPTNTRTADMKPTKMPNGLLSVRKCLHAQVAIHAAKQATSAATKNVE